MSEENKIETPVQEPLIEQVTPTENKVEEEKPVEESIQDRNWKKFREDRELERRQREEAEKRAAQKSAEAEALKAAMESILNKQPMPQNTNHNQWGDEKTEDQKIEEKIQAALQKQQNRFDEERRQREAAEVPQRLAQTYSDFNNVCSTENLDYLEYHYPEIAGAFKTAPDTFDKWSNIYKAIRKLVPNPDSTKEKKKVENNVNKPQSMAVAGTTQTGDSAPQILDDKRRADNWQRMQKVMKGGR